MKILTHKDAPIRVFGVPFFEEKKTLERLPGWLIEELHYGEKLGRRCPGARLGFRTDASEFEIEISLEAPMSVDVGMSIFSCQSAEVRIGERSRSRFAGLVNPPNYQTPTFRKKITKSNKLEEVTIFLPRNEIVKEVKLTFPDDALVEAPTPYRYGPVLYYGSSITEGGCCCRLTNAYNALLSNRLDIDYYNFGFSGSAKGELQAADYINTMEIKALVYDYDHNSPSVEHLQSTHEAFFKRIREKNPTLPVIMMGRPDFDYGNNAEERREVIYTTYRNAIANGDKNVYYIDSETFFGDVDREQCTIDRVHPNDLGFYRMASVVEPVLRAVFDIK